MSAACVRDRAKAVIASLWNVDDASTGLLMQQFYKNLARGKLTKAEALQQAPLSLLHGTTASANGRSRSSPDGTIVPVPIAGSTATATNRNYAHSYYWAPFVLMGNSL